jgi:hypothetical protein
MNQTLILPTSGKEIPRPWFLPSQAALDEQRRILEGTFFLVRTRGNSGIGEALICDPKKGGCGGKHTYLTLRCVEQPFSGLTGGLVAYYKAVRDSGLMTRLSAPERLRMDAMRRSLSDIDRLPDLAAHHPETARLLTRDLGQRDAVLAGQALGILEPIPVTLARAYAKRINMRGCRPRFTLPGLDAA